MSVKKLILEYLATLPDDGEPQPKGTDIDNGDDKTDGNVDSPADTNNDKPDKAEDTPEPTAIKKEASTVENTEIDAPDEPKDVTIINSADMLDSSVDMRLAAFYTKQQELEDTVKILISEVQTLKSHFEAVEKAIDVASESSPTVETIESLVNML